MSNGLKTIILSVAAVITVAAISFLFLTTGVGKQFVNETVPKLFQHSDKDSSGVYEAYNGTTVFGSDVLAAIDKYSESIPIRVTLGNGVELTSFDSVRDSSSDNYLNPMGTFKASLVYDDEDGTTVVAIVFNQIVDKVTKPTAVVAPPSTQVEIPREYELSHITVKSPTMYTLEGASDFNRYGMEVNAYFVDNNGQETVMTIPFDKLIAAGKYHGKEYSQGEYHDRFSSDYDKSKHRVSSGDEDTEHVLNVSYTYGGKTVYSKMSIMVTKPVTYTKNAVCVSDGLCDLCMRDDNVDTMWAGHPIAIVSDKVLGGDTGVTITATDTTTSDNRVSDNLSSDSHTYQIKCIANANTTLEFTVSRYVTDEEYKFTIKIKQYAFISKYNVYSETSSGTIGTDTHLLAQGDTGKFTVNANTNFAVTGCGSVESTGDKTITIKAINGSDTDSSKTVKISASDKVSGFTITTEHRVYAPLAVNYAQYKMEYSSSNTTKSTGVNTKKVTYGTSDTSVFTLQSGIVRPVSTADTMVFSDPGSSGKHTQLTLTFPQFNNRKLSSEVYVYKAMSISVARTGTNTYGCANSIVATVTGGYAPNGYTYSWTAPTVTLSATNSVSEDYELANLLFGEPETANADTNTYSIAKLIVNHDGKTYSCVATDSLGTSVTGNHVISGVRSSFSTSVAPGCTDEDDGNDGNCPGCSYLCAGHPAKFNLNYDNSGSGGTFSIKATDNSKAVKYGTSSDSTTGYTLGEAGLTAALGSTTQYYFTTVGNVEDAMDGTIEMTVSRTDTGESATVSQKFRQITMRMTTSDVNSAREAGTLSTNYIVSASNTVTFITNSHNVGVQYWLWKNHKHGNDATVIANLDTSKVASIYTIEDSTDKTQKYDATESKKSWFYLDSDYQSSDDNNKFSGNSYGSCTSNATATTETSSSTSYTHGQDRSWLHTPSGASKKCNVAEGVATSIFTDSISGEVIVRRYFCGTKHVQIFSKFDNTGDGDSTVIDSTKYTMSQHFDGSNPTRRIDVDKSSDNGYGYKDIYTDLSETGTTWRPFTACSATFSRYNGDSSDKKDGGYYKSEKSLHTTCGQDGYVLTRSSGVVHPQYTSVTGYTRKFTDSKLNKSRSVSMGNVKIDRAAGSTDHDELLYSMNSHCQWLCDNNDASDTDPGGNDGLLLDINCPIDRIKITFTNYCTPIGYMHING